MQNKPTYGMTSQEAAALYLSEGRTDDPGLASMLDYAKKQPELLIPRGSIPMNDYQPPALVIDDPDETERIRLRNCFGFDIKVVINEETMRATFKDTELKSMTRCRLTGDAQEDSISMTHAMLRLKGKHDRVN